MRLSLSNSALMFALCGLSASASAKAPPRSLNAQAIQQRMNQIPISHWVRNLDENQWEITEDYSVKFNECLSLKVLDEEGDEDGNSVAGTADYVILDAINSYDGSVKNFAVDLTTFVTTLASYIPDQMNDYCQACDYDACMYAGDGKEEQQQQQQQQGYDEDGDQEEESGEEESGEGEESGEESGEEESEEGQSEEEQGSEEGESGEEQESGEGESGDQESGEGESGDQENEGGEGEDGKDRRLEQNAGKTVYTECDTCNSLGCFEAENDDNNVLTKEYAVEWLLNLGECQAINEDYYNYEDANGYQLYAGYTCNSDGTGMEIGVFADEACSLLTDTSFATVLSSGGNAATYQSMTANLVHRVFVQYFDCMNTEYVNPNDNADEDGDGDEDGNDDNEFGANEYCAQLFEENAIAMDESCSNGDGNNDNGYEYDEDGNPWGQYVDANGNTISYDVQDADDAEQVCFAIQGMDGEYSTAISGENLYDYSSLGEDDPWTWDSGKEGQNDKIMRNSSGNLWDKTKDSVSSLAAKYGFSAAEMWGIVIGSLIALMLVLFLIVRYTPCCGRKKKASLSLDDDDAITRSRREPLVNPELYVA